MIPLARYAATAAVSLFVCGWALAAAKPVLPKFWATSVAAPAAAG